MGYLDHVAKKLHENGVRYHAHLDTSGTNEGSVWTQGIGGLAFEFHGRFDYSFFTTEAGHGGHGTESLHQMSLCTHDSEEPLMATHNASVWGQPLDEKISDDEIANATADVTASPPPPGGSSALAQSVDATWPAALRRSGVPLEEGLGEAIASMRAAAAAAPRT